MILFHFKHEETQSRSRIWFHTRKFKAQGSVHRKYILIHIQQDAALHSLFISGNCSTYFRWYLHPSSGAHTTVSTVSDTCQTVNCYLQLSWRSWNSFQLLHDSGRKQFTVWEVSDAVDTVVCAPDDGWRYQLKYVEQFPEINKLCNAASCSIYIRISIQGNLSSEWSLTFRRRIKSHLPFAGIIRRLPYSTRFQDKG